MYLIFFFRLLKNAPTNEETLGSAGLKPMTSPSGALSNSPSPVFPGSFGAPPSIPGNTPQIPSLPGGISSSSLEMLLLERAKLLQQQQNPVAKAFAELQGNYYTHIYLGFIIDE